MKTTFAIALGKKIKELRKRRNITQEQLAELVKTSYKYIQRIEGKTLPDIRISTLYKIGKALKTTPANLLD